MTQIVVSGIGLLTPLGGNRESCWAELVAGRSAVDGATAACPLPPDDHPRAVQLGLAAAHEALADAGMRSPLGERWGCLVSCSKPMLAGADMVWPGEVPTAVSREFGVRGPVMNLASACATGLHSVMVGAEWIREGRSDFVLAGSTESSLHPLYLSGFSQLGVLSRNNRVRPFDLGRDGFVIGEGAAVFVLESQESARRRGARVYGALRGWDFSCDASHATRFNSNGRKIADSLGRALRRSGLPPESLGYINAHGTATQANDSLEAQALRTALGDRIPPTSSTKAATGHLLGATGAVELAFSLLALRDGVLPPTLHLSDPLTEDIDFIPGRARRRTVRAAATLSFGFGGALASMVVHAS